MRVLILFGTSEGHTRKIASFLSDRRAERAHEVTVINAQELPLDLDAAAHDAVIIAARVHAGSYPRSILNFVRKHRDRLQRIATAFISVSMAAARHRPGDEEREAQYLDKFIAKTGWKPQHVHHAAGARLYTKHNAFTRWILGMIDGHRYEPSRDHEFTDWEKLAEFAEEVVSAVIRQAPETEMRLRANPSRGKDLVGAQGPQEV